MRLTLQIESGFHQGHRWHLIDGQSITVGRTEWADVSCEADESMSRVHFQVSVNPDGCELKDLNSTNGTRLNGEYVQVAALVDGDRIEAGRSVFVVEIEGAASGGADGEAGNRTSHEPVYDHKRTVADVSIAYALDRCESGLMCFEGGPFGQPLQPEAPAQIATLLNSHSPMTLLVDPRKAGEIPESLGQGEPLFDWLPRDVAAQHSPLAISVKASPDLDGFVNDGWDNDGLMILFHDGEASRLVDHLRASLRLAEDGIPISGPIPSAPILGYYYPSVLTHLISTGTESSVNRLFQGIDAVLMEIPGQESGWRIYARETFQSVVHQAGFFENKAVEA